MITLDNQRLREELDSQSNQIFGAIGLGGYVGPAMEQFDRLRSAKWPTSRSILRRFGLPKSASGWRWLLMAFGYTVPTPSEIQVASQRRKEPEAEPIEWYDDDYSPGLVASGVQESISLVPLGNGQYQRRVTRVYQLR